VKPTDITVLRIIDAAHNRASEGLRVVEDYTRMVLDDKHLSKRLKEIRHSLTKAATEHFDSLSRHTARDTVGDVGRQVSTATENHRQGVWQVAAAGFKRAEQALRTLEEYSKIVDTTFAALCESHRYTLYTIEKAVDLTGYSQHKLSKVSICYLLDRCDSMDDFSQKITHLAAKGACLIQLRDKELNDSDLIRYAQLLQQTARPLKAITIINDRPDIAAAVDADGVHLGQDDLPVAAARKVLGPHKLIGVSTHNIDQARQAVLDGANYIGAGPTFPSNTKQFAEFPGLDYLREVAAEISLPTFAIGGIQQSNIDQVLATGITRVAVASAITRADDPQQAAADLQTAILRTNVK